MQSGGRFFDDFIDDYFSECDEHLETVRRTLLLLEEGHGSTVDPAAIHDLSRALHTLKGLSGMVGLSAAEEVAHAMEECVRAIGSTGFASPELTESLFAGEALLDSCIASHRAGNTIPSPGPYVDRVRDVVAMAGDTLRATTNDRSPAAIVGVPEAHLIDGGVRVQRFDFSPSADLASRGVGVELVRQRLGAIGHIVATTPRVLATGGVVFEFDVALREGISPDESWRSDGLSWNSSASANQAAVTSVGMVVHAPRRGTAPLSPTASNVVRVDLARLDELMRMVGELVITRSRLGESVAHASGGLSSNAWDDLNEANETLERQLRSIREGVMRIRLVPIGEVFERMRFAMRDIARETGKAIHLQFDGQTTEIDKLVVDRMLEPLLHLVRNAASHGIESRADRVAAGKAPDGTISLRARAAGDRIVIEVEDDGTGIDGRRIASRAAELSLLPVADARSAEALPPDALLDIICSPGFSTRDTADMASGRGVGMAVVRGAIRRLGGELFVESVLGQGTRFTIELPLTLMIADALILEIGDQAMAIPQVALREILPFDRSAVTQFENNEVLSYRGRVLPLVDLNVLFKFPSRAGAPRHVLIVGGDYHLAGLVVDRILGLREIVVHPVTDPLIAVPGVSGATELSDGRVGLILDAAALVRGTRDRHARTAPRTLAAHAPNAAPALTSPEHAWS
jgi:two-component system chemotaxis sensor kinase CheA